MRNYDKNAMAKQNLQAIFQVSSPYKTQKLPDDVCKAAGLIIMKAVTGAWHLLNSETMI